MGSLIFITRSLSYCISHYCRRQQSDNASQYDNRCKWRFPCILCAALRIKACPKRNPQHAKQSHSKPPNDNRLQTAQTNGQTNHQRRRHIAESQSARLHQSQRHLHCGTQQCKQQRLQHNKQIIRQQCVHACSNQLCGNADRNPKARHTTAANVID